MKENKITFLIIIIILSIAVTNAAMNEDVPKISMQVLKQQFERTAQEKVVPSDRETATPTQVGQVCVFNKRNLDIN